jgi:glucosylceramidase
MIQQFCTAKDTEEKLAELQSLEFINQYDEDTPKVIINDNKTFQTIEGFGGAFTEAASTTFDKMSEDKQDEIIKAYFSPDYGHGYSLCRTHINSCDFSLGNYAYTEVDGDVELEHFSLERDQQSLIPLIKKAQAVLGADFKLFASPWSPPAWMKTTGMMNKGGKLKPEYRDTWARYYARYIKEYDKEGIPIWGLTVQNEPAATQSWDSCIYTAEEERDFVRDHLGPILEKENLSGVKIIIWDHNRDYMYQRAKTVFDDPEAAKYVWGTGFHWYMDDKFDNVQLLHDAFPDKKLLFTEGCQEGGPHLGSWDLGERYATSMISDLNKWCVGWVDWNIILDETGGPNHVGNLCSAPIIADTQNNEILYQSSYYYIGHFSRFIKPGAKRIISSSTKDALEVTAFVNPDASIVAVIMNKTDESIEFNLDYKDGSAATEIPARAIKTFVF